MVASMIALIASAAWAQTVLGYHNSPDRSGRYIVPGLNWGSAAGMHRDTSFDGAVEGNLYAQPLLWLDRAKKRKLIIAATESDNVYALDAATGHVIWRKALGAPAPRSALPCGNISPLGITGTPVIDDNQGKLYLDAMIDAGHAGPQHLIFGLSLTDGSILPGYPINVALAIAAHGMRFEPRIQNQRGALLIIKGTLYVPYGGHYGDCGPYHGWVLGFDLKNPQSLEIWRTRAHGGGIWAPGGVVYDGHSIFVATGNTFGAQIWSDGEAVMRLGTDLAPSSSTRDYFAPTDWKYLDATDHDLGGANPLPIDISDAHGTAHFILALGKDGKAYLLDRGNLGGIGGALAVEQVSRDQIRTAPVAYSIEGSTFVAFGGRPARCARGPSRANLTVLRIEAHPAPKISIAWCGDIDGRGIPILTTERNNSDPIVWIAGAEGDNRLHGFRADNGAPVFTGGGAGDLMQRLRHFATIVAADGRLFVPADNRIYAFVP